MSFSESSNHHVSHILELEILMFDGPIHESSFEKEPEGYMAYWREHLARLYLVSIYIYINEVAGSKKFWNTSLAFSSYPELVRCLEVMRLLRNNIVHSGGIADPATSSNGQKIRNFEADAQKGNIKLQWQGEPVIVRPFFSLDTNGRVSIHRNGVSMIRFLAVAALEIEGVVAVVK